MSEISHENTPESVQSEATEEKYILTPWGCLSAVLTDYNVDTSHITGRMGEHMVEDFMELMVKAGHVGKAGKEGD